MPRFKMSQPFSSQPIADAASLSAEPFSSPSRRQGRATGHSSAALLPARSGASKTAPSRAFCISTENADSSSPSLQFVRVTHPFHPLFGRQLPCVGKRYNRYGERLLLQADDAAIWSVPPRWTDLVSPDLEVVMGDGRAVMRFTDLLELADLVDRLSGKSLGKA